MYSLHLVWCLFPSVKDLNFMETTQLVDLLCKGKIKPSDYGYISMNIFLFNDIFSFLGD